MALKAMLSRQVTWVCKECGQTNIRPTGNSTNQTTKSAEDHADEKGHTVMAVGTIFYSISHGSTLEDDPFSARERG